MTANPVIIGAVAKPGRFLHAQRRSPSPEARDNARTAIRGQANPRIIHGDRIDVMRTMESGTVDFRASVKLTS